VVVVVEIQQLIGLVLAQELVVQVVAGLVHLVVY
jgi:hypothetical protein